MLREALAKELAQGTFRRAIRFRDGRCIPLGFHQQGGAEQAARLTRGERRGFLSRGQELRRDRHRPAAQGSGAGLGDSVRRKAMTSARCWVLAMPEKAMRVPGMARAGAAMNWFSAS